MVEAIVMAGCLRDVVVRPELFDEPQTGEQRRYGKEQDCGRATQGVLGLSAQWCEGILVEMSVGRYIGYRTSA